MDRLLHLLLRITSHSPHEHVRSKNSRRGAMNLVFPRNRMSQARRSGVYVNRARASCRGRCAAFIMRYDAGSFPLAQLVFFQRESQPAKCTTSRNRVRPIFATCPRIGASALEATTAPSWSRTRAHAGYRLSRKKSSGDHRATTVLPSGIVRTGASFALPPPMLRFDQTLPASGYSLRFGRPTVYLRESEPLR